MSERTRLPRAIVEQLDDFLDLQPTDLGFDIQRGEAPEYVSILELTVGELEQLTEDCTRCARELIA